MSTASCDAIIIGSGQGGTPLASALANAGKKTVLVESVHLGGTCVNEGCTPTKTMVTSARIAYLASQARKYGVELKDGVKVNMDIVRKRKRDIVDSFRGGSERRVQNTLNLEWIVGEATFVGEKEVTVRMKDGSETRNLKAENIFINVGCRPAPLKLPGAENIKILDSTTVMELDEIPKHLVVLGGGYVGLEFAQMFRRFGSEVTVVQRGAQLLPKEDEDIATSMQDIVTEDGLKICLKASATSVSPSATDRSICLELTTPQGPKTLICSHILVAAGRIPNTSTLNLPATKVDIDQRGFIPTDSRLQTSVPSIYAIGDVRGGPAFTHASYDDFRVVRDNLLSSKPRSFLKSSSIPYTVFTDPQLGRIGLSARQARSIAQSSGRQFLVADMPMAWVARALETDETRGMMRGIVDKETGKIEGFACLGTEGGEMCTMVQIAMAGGLKYSDLENMVLAHPGWGESLNNLWGNLKPLE